MFSNELEYGSCHEHRFFCTIESLYCYVFDQKSKRIVDDGSIKDMVLALHETVHNLSPKIVYKYSPFIFNTLIKSLSIVRNGSLFITTKADCLCNELFSIIIKLVNKCRVVNNTLFLRVLDSMLVIFDSELDKSNILKENCYEFQDIQYFNNCLSEEGRLLAIELFSSLLLNYEHAPSTNMKFSAQNCSQNSDVSLVVHQNPSTIESNSRHHSKIDLNKNLLEDEQTIPIIGYSIYVILGWAIHDKNRDVQVNSLLAIKLFVQKISKFFVLEKFAPGILASIVKILKGNFKQGKRVFCQTFLLLQTVVTKLLSEKKTHYSQQEHMHKNFNKTVAEIVRLKELKSLVRESKKEITDGTNNAIYHIESLIVSLFSSNYQKKRDLASYGFLTLLYKDLHVKMAMSQCCYGICTNCHEALSLSIPILLDVLIYYSSDSYQTLSDYCSSKLNVFLLELQKDIYKSKRLIDLISNHVYTFVSSIPCKICKADDSKIVWIRFLLGYYNFYSGICPMLTGSLISKIFNVLSQFFTINSSNLINIHHEGILLNMNDEKCLQSFNFEFLAKHYSIYNKYLLDDEDLHVQSLKLLRKIGFHAPCPVIIDQIGSILLELQSCEEVFCNQETFVFLLNELLLGAFGYLTPGDFESRYSISENAEKKYLNLLLQILDIYTSSQMWKTKPDFNCGHDKNTVEAGESSESKSFSVRSTLLSCLLLEGVANIAIIFNIQFIPKLGTVLYLIFEKFGDSDKQVSYSAFIALQRIALGVGYKSVFEMVKSNIHLIVNSMSCSIRYFKNYDNTLKVLQGLMRYMGEDMVPYVDSFLDEIFIGLDQRQEQYTPNFLKTLYLIVLAVGKIDKDENEHSLYLDPNVQYKISSNVCDHNASKSDNSKNTQLELESCSITNWTLNCRRKERPVYKNKSKRSRASSKNSNLNAFLRNCIQTKIEEQRLAEEFNMRKNKLNIETVEERMRKHHSLKDLKEDETEDINVVDEDQKEVEHFVGFDLVTKILKKLEHWTNTKSIDTRILVLRIIRNGLYIIKNDKKILLPILHTLWDPLKFRFLDSNYNVLIEALEVMKTMSYIAGGFVTRKFIDDLWPILKKILRAHNIYSFRGTQSVMGSNELTQYTRTNDLYAFEISPSSFTQKAVINCLSFVIMRLKLPSKILSEIAENCWFYLDVSQTEEIQSLAVKLYLNLYYLEQERTLVVLMELGQIQSKISQIRLTYFLNSREELDFLAEGISEIGTNNDKCLILPKWILNNSFVPKKLESRTDLVEHFYLQFSKNVAQILSQVSNSQKLAC